MIDLRSDTVTRPTPAMRRAIAEAPVGDDVYSEDPTINRLESEGAALLGKEAALFTPTCTMANQLALRASTRPGDAIIVESGSHIANYESGAPAMLSGLTLIRVPGGRGILDATAALAAADRLDDVHFAPSALIAVENTANLGGGALYPADTLAAIAAGAAAMGLWSHCDGARLWNAAAATGRDEASLVAGYGSVSVCLSKGLGAPAGALLAGPKDFIKTARRFRKMLGGGMRQGGILAAGGLHGLTHHRARLADDHARAAWLAEALTAQGWTVQAPETNMVYITLDNPAALVASAQAKGVRFSAIGRDRVRLVTHLDITDADITKTIAVLDSLR
ncbi:MAG: threonine aldolase [Myxococcota bacterium]|jgi:threonine aldolase